MTEKQNPDPNTPRNLLEKLVKGDRTRKSRFHDAKGNLVDFRGATYAPRAITGVVANMLFGYRPRRPWISYRATRYLDRALQSGWSALEFGSGMSTLWLSERCRFVLSIEHDPQWYARVKGLLQRRGARNVQIECRPLAIYPDLSAFADSAFDFALIDGVLRARCTQAAAAKVRAGGLIYLDDTDKQAQQGDGDLRQAELALLAIIAARCGQARYFVDFTPAIATVHQGLLAIL